MIHREATIKYKGYDPDELKPKSGKRICCICDKCGRVRWMGKGNYCDLCHKCPMKKCVKNGVSKEGGRKRSNDPKWGKNITEANKNLSNDPKWLKNVTVANRKKVKDPIWRRNHKEGIIKNSEDPNFGKKISAGMQNILTVQND